MAAATREKRIQKALAKVADATAYIAADEAKPEMTIDTGDAHLDANGRDTRWTDMGDKPGGISTAHAALPRLRFLAEAAPTFNSSTTRSPRCWSEALLGVRDVTCVGPRSFASRSRTAIQIYSGAFIKRGVPN